MPICVRCQHPIGVLGRLGYNKRTSRCGPCEHFNQRALERFQQAFRRYCQEPVFTEEHCEALKIGAARDRLHLDEALAFVGAEAVSLLWRGLAFALADGTISEAEEQQLRRLRRMLAIPDEHALPILERLAQLRRATSIRQGHLPLLQPGAELQLDPGERCHLDQPAMYQKASARAVAQIPGRLIATSQRLLFVSASGRTRIAWPAIVGVDRDGGGIELELTTRHGSGRYLVPEPLLAEATIATLLRMNQPPPPRTDRLIPPEIKQLVWQRDHGACAQCGATAQLEFDRIMSLSKGGDSSAHNLRLLCRECHGRKGLRAAVVRPAYSAR